MFKNGSRFVADFAKTGRSGIRREFRRLHGGEFAMNLTLLANPKVLATSATLFPWNGDLCKLLSRIHLVVDGAFRLLTILACASVGLPRQLRAAGTPAFGINPLCE